MMSLSEERYLSTSSLSPSYTHFIASLKNVWYDNYLLWVLLSIFARQFHHNSIPKSPLCAYSFQEGQNYSKAPSENFYQGGHGVILFKKKEVPMILSKRVQIRSSNKMTQNISKCESISSLSPKHLKFHKIRIWSSTYLSRSTLWLGNIGNQGMLHSSYANLHKSALE